MKTSVDWARLVFRVRRKQPGALEVLQDAIEMYFPRQFHEAKMAAKKLSERNYKENVLVGFNSQIAARRFWPAEKLAKSRKYLDKRFDQLTKIDSAKEREYLVERNKLRWAKYRSKRTASQIEEGSPFRLFSLVPLAWSTSFDFPAARRIQSSAPPPYTALVYQVGTRRRKETERRVPNENVHIAHPRPKIPVIFWFRNGGENGGYNGSEDEEREETILIVRGPGAGDWAREKFSIQGETWTRHSANVATAQLQGWEPWIQDARREGYRNKVRFLDGDPGRQFLEYP